MGRQGVGAGNVGLTYRKSLCPLVLCPYLWRSEDLCSGGAAVQLGAAVPLEQGVQLLPVAGET